MDRIEEIKKEYRTHRTCQGDWLCNTCVLLAHISALEKRVEAQGRVVEAARKFHEGLVCDGPEYCALSDALREVGE